MKYIRTKDGIFILADDINNLVKHGYIVVANKIGATRTIEVDDFVKLADTIIELIDGWIIDCPTWDKPIFKRELQFINWQDYVKTANKYKAMHYGAICIRLPNGAIRIEPVAKMNEKGELELL